jgi:MFS family permease
MSTIPDSVALDRKHRLVIFASSLGTVFEWYDFYIYGTLATFFSKYFFPANDQTAAFLSSLALFGVGFAVRPFGALVFGRIGDLVGRKYTFLVTIVVMGLATALVGVLPGYQSIGYWAPVILVLLRMAQGLALGGEYGWAATYVAEHAPPGKRGAFTSWIQTTATLGFFISLAVVYGVRHAMTPAKFEEWGWRLPFLVSLVLLGVSVYIRLKLEESPVFAEMKAEGKTSKAPLRESFAHRPNAQLVLKALFGAAAGQGVVWYTGQFYALYFLSTPFIVICGRLSDRIGRKPIMLAGCLLAALTYQPIFSGLTRAANPALADAMAGHAVVLHTAEYRGAGALTVAALSDAARKIILPAKAATTDTEKARAFLNGRGTPFTLAPARPEAPLVLTVGDGTPVAGFDRAAYEKALAPAGYPTSADPARVDKVKVIALLTVLMIYVAMVYGPIAAFLVELFPARIRYTSMSLPYHIGNGWFGGFLPLIAASIVVFTGDIYAGLWYPIGIAALSFLIGLLVLPETKDREIKH